MREKFQTFVFLALVSSRSELFISVSLVRLFIISSFAMYSISSFYFSLDSFHLMTPNALPYCYSPAPLKVIA